MHDGRFANNGWLQELPKPFNKVVWENVAFVSPRLAEKLGVSQNDRVIQGVEVDIVEVVHAGHALQAPVWILPGQPDDSIGLQLGYGRTAAGRVGNGLGYNANFFRYSTTPWTLGGIEVRKTALRTGSREHAGALPDGGPSPRADGRRRGLQEGSRGLRPHGSLPRRRT